MFYIKIFIRLFPLLLNGSRCMASKIVQLTKYVTQHFFIEAPTYRIPFNTGLPVIILTASALQSLFHYIRFTDILRSKLVHSLLSHQCCEIRRNNNSLNLAVLNTFGNIQHSLSLHELDTLCAVSSQCCHTTGF